ncbi:cyclic pyranopterin monophosphate synthase-like [Tigriopus californicus]|uniref:cyclic pyranopterin monophosphate synthase-like n=1 Tax=Tigriopus californicus TaxID=6832 RepID=UPI0027D9EA27|nr:cyclic pyranopterin monophosphate synthase-like [Tigriopus californicus]
MMTMLGKYLMMEFAKAYSLRIMARSFNSNLYKPVYPRHDLMPKQYWEMDHDFKLTKGDYGTQSLDTHQPFSIGFNSFTLAEETLIGAKESRLVEQCHADSNLSHIDAEGKAKMVDVSAKPPSQREAVAKAKIVVGAQAFQLVEAQEMKKGDVLTVSQLAGIMGAKRTGDLIPLCHPVALSSVNVKLQLQREDFSVEITCVAKCQGQTGVEMEALTGATIAALTVYDMCKAVSKQMVIQEVYLAKKTGGKSDIAFEP